VIVSGWQYRRLPESVTQVSGMDLQEWRARQDSNLRPSA
jgi:hypothetical protein